MVVSRTLTLNVACDSDVQVSVLPKSRNGSDDSKTRHDAKPPVQQQQQQADIALEDESIWSVLKKIILTLFFAGLFLMLYAFC